jgi:hypothetical protein
MRIRDVLHGLTNNKQIAKISIKKRSACRSIGLLFRAIKLKNQTAKCFFTLLASISTIRVISASLTI